MLSKRQCAANPASSRNGEVSEPEHCCGRRTRLYRDFIRHSFLRSARPGCAYNPWGGPTIPGSNRGGRACARGGHHARNAEVDGQWRGAQTISTFAESPKSRLQLARFSRCTEDRVPLSPNSFPESRLESASCISIQSCAWPGDEVLKMHSLGILMRLRPTICCLLLTRRSVRYWLRAFRGNERAAA